MSALPIALLLSTQGCSSHRGNYRSVPPRDLRTAERVAESKQVRLTMKVDRAETRRVTLNVRRVAFPLVLGTVIREEVETGDGVWREAPERAGVEEAIDLDTADSVEVPRGRNAGEGMGSVVAELMVAVVLSPFIWAAGQGEAQ